MKLEFVTIRLTKGEKDQLKKYARESKMPLSEYIRLQLFVENTSVYSLPKQDKVLLKMLSSSLSVLQALSGKAFSEEELEEIKMASKRRLRKEGF